METWRPEGVEEDPASLGLDPARLADLLALVRRHGGSAQVTLLRNGRVAVDRRVGEGLAWMFSASKPVIAVLAYQLVEEGALTLDLPVADYWPEFAANGKGGITVRHVLQHRSGLPTAGARLGGALGDVLAMTDWERQVRRFERARPAYPPGTVPAYQYLAHGVILGELVRRVTGRELPGLVAERIAGPLGLADFHLGLPPERSGEAVPLRASGPAAAVTAAWANREVVRAAVIPAAGLSATTADLARFYLALLRDGDGSARLLAPSSIRALRRPSDRGQIDRFVHLNVRYGQGVQLGGPRNDVLGWGPFGRTSSPRAFGHNGSNVAIAWADPDRDLVLAYSSGRMTNYPRDFSHMAAVSDAAIAAVVG